MFLQKNRLPDAAVWAVPGMPLPGENLTFSIILRPNIPPDRMDLLSLLVAVGIARGIEEALGVRVFCKWPNDLLYGGRKLAGILLEGSFADDQVDHVVVGIGLNVNQREFPDDIAARATSLARETQNPIDRSGLLKSLLKSLEDEYLQQSADGFHYTVARWLEYAPHHRTLYLGLTPGQTSSTAA